MGTFLVTSVILLTAGVLSAAESKPDMEAMGKTGPEHAALAKAVGEWHVESTMWMSPEAAPMRSKATATFTAVLDGRWIRQEYTGEWMDRPFIGIGMNGYDNQARQHVTMWFDNASTAAVILKGERAEDGAITYRGVMEHCPNTGGAVVMRHVCTMPAPGRMIYTMYSNAPGAPEQKRMELVYTRREPTR